MTNQSRIALAFVVFTTVISGCSTNQPKVNTTQDAANLISAGKYKEAENAYRTQINHDRNDSNAAYGLVRLLLHQGRYAEALGYINMLPDNTQNIELLNDKGFVNYKLGNFARALNYFRQAVSLSPRSARSHYNLATIYLAQKEVSKALLELRKAVDIEPSNMEARLQYGLTLVLLDQNKQAIEFWESGKLNAQINYYLGVGYLDLNLDKRAKTYFESALKLDPNFKDAHNGLAAYYLRKGDLSNAILEWKLAINSNQRQKLELANNFQSSIDLNVFVTLDVNNSENLQVLNNAGIEAAQRGELQVALDKFYKATTLAPSNRSLKYNLALVYYKLGRFKEALTVVREIVLTNPTEISPYQLLAEIYQRQGDFKSAISSLQQALELQPESASVYVNLGVVHFNNNDLVNAEQEWIKAAELDPKFASPSFNLGLMSLRAGKYEEARVYLTRALTLRPDDGEAAVNLGYVISQLGDLQAAIAVWQQALNINKGLSLALNNIGVAYFELGKFKEAGEVFSKTIVEDETLSEAYNNLAAANLQGGDQEKAIQAYQAAVRLNPLDEEAHRNLGLLYLKNNQLDEAIKELQSSLAINKDQPILFLNLGVAYKSLGKNKEAEICIKQFLIMAANKPELYKQSIDAEKILQ